MEELLKSEAKRLREISVLYHATIYSAQCVDLLKIL